MPVGICLLSWSINIKILFETAYTRPTYLIFGMVKDADNIYYCIKNHGRGLCVGGEMLIFLFGSFHRPGELHTLHGEVRRVRPGKYYLDSKLVLYL